MSRGIKAITPEQVLKKFWAYVSLASFSGCWIWEGPKVHSGQRKNKCIYGRMNAFGKEWRAHRLSWLLHKGEIPSGLEVLHKCDVPSCVNPEHLFLGTQADNAQDMVAKGRSNVGQRHWNAKLSDAKVSEIVSLKGHLAQVTVAWIYGVTKSRVCQLWGAH